MKPLPSQMTPGRRRTVVGFTCLLVLGFSPAFGGELMPPPVTSNEEFFTLGLPLSVPNNWRLTVAGVVERELSLSLDEILQYRATTEMSTLECFFPMGPWLLIGNADWTGVPLNTILDAAGLLPAARSIAFRALDGYELGSLPLDEMRQRNDILLAYGMNGEALPPIQGYPLKLVLPGMAGSQNIRWLDRITVSTLEPTRELLHYPIHARILKPKQEEVIPAGTCVIRGLAFAGKGVEITGVEVSADQGQTWSPATILNHFLPNVWMMWECKWDFPQVGRHQIFARVTDRQGAIQPADGAFGWQGFDVSVTVDSDHDGDGVADSVDNCPDRSNPRQSDADRDGLGNPCDADCPRLNPSGVVNLADFAVLATSWRSTGQGLPGDLNSDSIVNAKDLLILAGYWLDQCQP